jgi:hypothetical protein
MKVYLPAIIGYVPPMMVRAIATFIEICYIIRRSVIDENDLDKLEALLKKYHTEHEIFRTSGVRRSGFNLPCQHALMHYHERIRKFGAPNGHCSSITESKHKKDVKGPYKRSSRFNALPQMLVTNQWLDKLAANFVEFKARGLLDGSSWEDNLAPTSERARIDDEDEDGWAIDDRDIIGEVKLARKTGAFIDCIIMLLIFILHNSSECSLCS